MIWGTHLSRVHFRSRRFEPKHPLEPISILKPLKGADPGLRENLRSFFTLDYPDYELLFSVADASDPSVEVVNSLITQYPQQRSRLIVGEEPVGANPKVNNLIKSYQAAVNDWILISDSNIRVQPSYLKAAVENFDKDTGVVTAVVRGRSAERVGGRLESVFMNTFYARWMILTDWFGNSVVMGKSMLFRRSEANRFGGLRVLARFLAEDYMFGQAMQMLGKKVRIMHQAVPQPIGRFAIKDFWARHIRWGRIRKAQAPLAFVFEPFLSFWIAGVIGAWATNSLFGFEFLHVFALHILLWLLADVLLLRAMNERITPLTFLTWIVRETLHLPLWIHIASGKTVWWRGRKLTLVRGGTLQT